VFDRQGLGQEATFQLTGLDSVRKKIGLACKWPPTADKMSLGETMNQLGVAVGKHLRITRRGRMFVLVSKHHKHPYRN